MSAVILTFPAPPATGACRAVEEALWMARVHHDNQSYEAALDWIGKARALAIFLEPYDASRLLQDVNRLGEVCRERLRDFTFQRPRGGAA